MSEGRQPISQLFGQTISGICWEGERLCFINAEGKPIFQVVSSMIYSNDGNFWDTDEVAVPA